MGSARERYSSRDWSFAVCVPKVVLENKLGAGLGFGEFYGFVLFKEESWCARRRFEGWAGRGASIWVFCRKGSDPSFIKT
ncbi:hypothetical protein FF1_006389 [Malus domestica]